MEKAVKKAILNLAKKACKFYFDLGGSELNGVTKDNIDNMQNHHIVHQSDIKTRKN